VLDREDSCDRESLLCAAPYAIDRIGWKNHDRSIDNALAKFIDIFFGTFIQHNSLTD
jgi:hypothetical protein